ncbi:MAG: fluoride efflux transporter CrcB [Fimbriimonadaceae bacterium]
MDFKAYSAVFLGAGIGGVLRYQLHTFTARQWPDFPTGTLLANLLGCFAMGCLLAILSRDPNEYVRLGLGVGLLGGFTTFSAFSGETIQMLQRGHIGQALGYLVLSVGGSVLAAWLGLAVFRIRQ